MAVPRVDLDFDDERRGLVAFPGDFHKAFGVPAQQHHVRAVLAVDRDAPPQRDVADDLVAGHRATALGQAQHHVVDALHADPVLRRGARRPPPRAPHAQEVGAAVLAVGRLALLEALHDLVDDELGRDLGRAQGDVEVVRLAVADFADHVGEQRRAGDPLRRQALLAQVLLQQVAPAVLGVLARLGLEPLLDLVARARRLDDREPIARGAALAL